MTNPQYSENYLASAYADVDDFYFDKATTWLKFAKPAYFGFYDGNPSKPGIILPCGIYEEEINYKHLLLLKEALAKNPNLLNDFFDLVHDGDQPTAPKKRTSTTKGKCRRSSLNEANISKPPANIEFDEDSSL